MIKHCLATAIFVLCLWAVNASALDAYLPHLTEGNQEWEVLLEADNPGQGQAGLAVTLFDGGEIVASHDFVVPGQDTLNINLQTLSPSAGSGRVSYEDPDLQLRLIYRNQSIAGVTGFQPLPSAASRVALAFSDVLDVLWKGVAVMNTGGEQVQVTLYALSDGIVADQAVQTLPGLTRFAVVVQELFPGLETDGVDQVVAVAEGNVLAGLTISGTSAGAGLMALPGLAVSGFTPPDFPDSLALETVVSGLQSPLHATHAGDGSGRLFVVEKQGRIRIVHNGALLETPFLDITDRVGSSGGEQGLLCLAFPPGFSVSGAFYVNYTDPDGDTVVSRFSVSDQFADQADPDSEEILLTIDQPFGNHNGGQLAFGPDGHLYVGTGDGGGAGDPEENAQDGTNLLGKILRIDAESGLETYAIPPDNPFVDDAQVRNEIWALGLRNPWRFSFDRTTGNLFIADVGQNVWEEVNVAGGTEGGLNYGWDITEGPACFEPAVGCEALLPSAYRAPVHAYDHDLGNSITGGFVYRGAAFPSLQGVYVYGDFGSGRVWGLMQVGGMWANALLLDSDQLISSFGEGEDGEIYLCGYGSGTLFRVVVP